MHKGEKLKKEEYVSTLPQSKKWSIGTRMEDGETEENMQICASATALARYPREKGQDM